MALSTTQTTSASQKAHSFGKRLDRSGRELSPRIEGFKIPARSVSDMTLGQAPDDVAKGALCIRRKKMKKPDASGRPGALCFRLTGVSNQVWCVAEDGLRVLSAKNAKDIKVFTAPAEENEQVYFLAVVSFENLVYASTTNGRIHVYSSKTLEHVKTLHHSSHGQVNPHASVYCLYKSHHGVFSAASDRTICLWNPVTHDLKTFFSGIPAPTVGDSGIKALTVFKNEIWAGLENGFIYTFEIDHDGEEAHPEEHASQRAPHFHFQAHQAPITSLLTVDHETVWSGSDDRLIRVWNTNYAAINDLVVHKDSITALTNVSEGRVWSASNDKKVVVWNSKTYGMVGVMPGEFDEIFDLQVVGMYVWISSRDYVIRMFMTQGVAEEAQRYLNRYCVQSVGELENLYAKELEVNEQLHFLLRTTYSHMLAAGLVREAVLQEEECPHQPLNERTRSGTDWNSIPPHVRTTYKHSWLDGETISLNQLADRLTAFQKAREATLEHRLAYWDIESLRKHEASHLANPDKDLTKQTLNALRQAALEGEQAEHDTHQASIDLQAGLRNDNTATLLKTREAYQTWRNEANHQLETLSKKLKEYQEFLAVGHATEKAHTDAEIAKLTPELGEVRVLASKTKDQADALAGPLRKLKDAVDSLKKIEADNQRAINDLNNKIAGLKRETQEEGKRTQEVEAQLAPETKKVNEKQQEKAERNDELAIAQHSVIQVTNSLEASKKHLEARQAHLKSICC